MPLVFRGGCVEVQQMQLKKTITFAAFLAPFPDLRTKLRTIFDISYYRQLLFAIISVLIVKHLLRFLYFLLLSISL